MPKMSKYTEKIYLTYIDESENSKKFYLLQRQRDFFVATWGKIGTSGQNKSYSLEEANKKLAEKIAKGYKIVEFTEKKPENEPKENEPKESINFMEELRRIS